ncbi:right-handed parallel beta-helix repeat-containing protein [Geobacter pelophilus]|uniref:Right-handed parallel beta-helix repeat-containing protein n=1 Tax=Geoanaerobacter pelophilus TaxID=60036 RepID=A0AAW4L9D8_9BACT|nr:right-handed parallel beta-helix repeat-containing protein [Geoanaerobacter pelophilus]MBT0664941.1 right-handed parallel beta-helix repeat-containing protein [Geoanaerobacter pelophilus]
MNKLKLTGLRKWQSLRVISKLLPVVVVMVGLLTASAASAQVLTENTIWSGDIRVIEDVVVPRGITLTILPGARIKFSQAESTKTDPEYISPLTELTIRGTLRAEGTATAPIAISGEVGVAGSWAGILIDGGVAIMRDVTVQNAENAIQVFSGSVTLDHGLLKGNRYGLVAQGKESHVRMDATVIRENDYGQLSLSGAEIVATLSSVTANTKRDQAEWAGKPLAPFQTYGLAPVLPLARVYKDEVLKGETILQGRIEIIGQVRVPEASRLVIMPGTVIEFRRRDTNGDGIGESGLLIQGVLIAKGTRKEPIFFRSAEKNPTMGDWDSINLMNSDGVQNLIEYCQIEDAYRGVHFHFSNVMVNRSVFTNNYRGVQFQESLVEIVNNRFYGNKSAVQGRDSEIQFLGNLVTQNLRGVNIYRAGATVSGNRFSGNTIDGLRIRDSGAAVERNVLDSNRYGLMAQDASYGKYSSNLVSGNAELGFSLKAIDNLELSGNYISGNGTNGISLQDVRALVKSNSFTDNRERGIGIISFDGTITANNFAGNGLYAIDLESAGDVAAPGNWWGGDAPDKVIFDGSDASSRGKVISTGASATPLPVVWPLDSVPVDLRWRGNIVANHNITVPSGVSLDIAPGTKISLAADVSMFITGKLKAQGKPGARITFVSTEPVRPGFWGEILLERASDSVVEYCDFKGATWALHSHFTNLVLSDSRFESNYGGMRFRSGPVTISRSQFRDNEIGIRSYRGVALVADNEISGNEIGIFVREKGSGLDIRNNDLSGNKSYAIRIGDFNDEDVKAVGNWWGAGDPGNFIFDARQEEGIGFVRHEPALTVKPNEGSKE